MLSFTVNIDLLFQAVFFPRCNLLFHRAEIEMDRVSRAGLECFSMFPSTPLLKAHYERYPR